MGIGVAGKRELFKILIKPRVRGPLFPVVGNRVQTPAGNEAFAEGGGSRQRWFLFNVHRAQAVLHTKLPCVQLFFFGNDLQKRAFPGAVAADEAHALSGFKAHGGVIQKRRITPGELGIHQ